MSETKKFLYLNRRAPYGTIYAWESLEVVLIGAAFEQDVSLAFVDDGVYQIKKGQDTSGIDMKNFSATFSALGDYEVTKLYVEKESLEERNGKMKMKTGQRKTRSSWYPALNSSRSWMGKTWSSVSKIFPKESRDEHLTYGQ